MRLIVLNAWGGTKLKSFIDFVKNESAHTDFFCFQEVFDSKLDFGSTPDKRFFLFRLLADALPDFIGHFSPVQDGYDYGTSTSPLTSFGTALFVRRTLTIARFSTFFIFGEKNSMTSFDIETLPFNAQIVTVLNAQNIPLTILNVHGMAMPWPKEDTPERFRQSRIIREKISEINTPVIICGDLNLFPETKSLEILSKGMVDLIRKYSITDTRGALHKFSPHVSDYIFSSPEIQCFSFMVPDVKVSDHLPLIFEFDFR